MEPDRRIKIAQQLGEEWIQAVIEKDFQRLASLCHAELRSRVMTPNRFVSLENAADLIQKIEKWYQDCDSIQIVQCRLAMVGTKLGIFYRLV